MCSRYWVDRSVDDELDKLNIGFHSASVSGKRDVHPTDEAVVICGTGNPAAGITTAVQKWGFVLPDRKVIINARAESVFDRKMFRMRVLHNRVAVPAAGFYEWNRQKEKSSFCGKNGILFFAGLADSTEKGTCFVIITTAANESVSIVHDRMPLLLDEGQVLEWICNDKRTADLLKQVPPVLKRKPDYEQMSLF